MAKIAHNKARREEDTSLPERGAEKLTRIARATADAGADAAREGAQRAAGAAEDLRETTRKAAEESTELGRAFVELMGEQTRQSVDTVNACARAVNWTDVAQAQSRLIVGSLLRIGQLNARYGELLLRGMTATPTLPRR